MICVLIVASFYFFGISKKIHKFQYHEYFLEFRAKKSKTRKKEKKTFGSSLFLVLILLRYKCNHSLWLCLLASTVGSFTRGPGLNPYSTRNLLEVNRLALQYPFRWSLAWAGPVGYPPVHAAGNLPQRAANRKFLCGLRTRYTRVAATPRARKQDVSINHIQYIQSWIHHEEIGAQTLVLNNKIMNCMSWLVEVIPW